MAIIFGQPECYICKQKIQEDEEWLATWGVPFVPPHYLYEFCDAPLHYSCLTAWPYREEFSLGYFQMFRYGHILAEGKLWFLSGGPSSKGERPSYVQVVLARWPIRLKLDKWQEWNHFVTDGFKEDLIGQCLADAEKIMEEVRKVAGNQEALNALHDANRVRSLMEE